MMFIPRGLFALAVLAVAARAEPYLPSATVPLDSLASFRSPAANWQVAGGLGGDPRRDKALVPLPGTGVLVNNPGSGGRGQLVTTWEHGDLDLDLDFLLPPGSNSGVYFMGRYELQLFDSWGEREPKFSDCGGIYQRWDAARGPGKEGYEGQGPRANACRAPGLWQHLRVEFRAPRFDAAGKKTANARFVKVVLNDFVIQENVEVTGPTRSPAFADEKPLGPLMIQGDHGSLALRRLSYKRYEPDAQVTAEGLAFKFYSGDYTKIGEYDSTPPRREGPLPRLAVDPTEATGHCALVFSGSFNVPRDGNYLFTADSRDSIRLVIDGQEALLPLDRGGLARAIALTAGRHAFRLDLLHTGWGHPTLDLIAEGPGLAPHSLTREDGRVRDPNPRQLIIEPARVRLQRGFVPFDPKKRLYAINVGTPAGVHYAYDFASGALLRVWHGSFLDTFEMWDGRGENQYAKPAGPALTLSGKPVLALLERSAHDWPDEPDMLWSSQGYRLEPDGQPVFLFKLASLTAMDRIAPAADGRGLTRTLNLSGWVPEWDAWVLLAEADAITPQPDGRGYIVGDRAYYIDLPADAAVQAIVRARNGRQQLVVPVRRANVTAPIVYTLVW